MTGAMRSPMLRRSHHSTGLDRAMDQVTMIFIDEPYFLEDEHNFVRYFGVSNRVPVKTDPYPYLSSNYTAKIEIHQPKGRIHIWDRSWTSINSQPAILVFTRGRALAYKSPNLPSHPLPSHAPAGRTVPWMLWIFMDGTLYCICIVSGCASEQSVVVGDESDEDVLKYFIHVHLKNCEEQLSQMKLIRWGFWSCLSI